MQLKTIGVVSVFAALAVSAAAQDVPADHLLITEIGINPASQSAANGYAEYVEIYNPTASAIPLDNYYITDWNQYYNWPVFVDSSQKPDLGTSDYLLQFPPGYSIPAGGVVVVTHMADTFLKDFYGSSLSNWQAVAGAPQLFETEEHVGDVPNMITHSVNPTLPTTFSKTNAGEFVALVHWDGQSDLVDDVDMVSWGNVAPGDGNNITQKGGIIVDGPDAGGDLSSYLVDNGVDTRNIDVEPLFDPNTLVRRSIIEIGESGSVGNGIHGQDESLEWCWDTWGVTEDNSSAGPEAHPGVVANLGSATTPPTPFIGAITRTEKHPAPGTQFKIQCKAGAATAPTVKLFVDSGSGFGSGVNMTFNAAIQSYEATVGPYPEGTYLRYYFEATAGGLTGRAPLQTGLHFEFFGDYYGIHVTADPVDDSDIIINEVQYNPAGGDNSTRPEYCEIHNLRSTPINLSSFYYSDFVTNPERCRLPDGAIIPANGYIVLASNRDLFLSRPEYAGVDPNIVFDMRDQFSGAAPGHNNDQDTPTVSNANDYRWLNRPAEPIETIHYTDSAPWPVGQNNQGPSIELKAPNLDNTDGANWAYSIQPYGSPGAANQQSSVGDWTIY